MAATDIGICEFEQLKRQPDIFHGIFTREGQEDVLKTTPLIFLNQVHGDTIKILKKDDNDWLENFQSGFEPSIADGIVTDMKDVFLVIRVADCQAVMLYDSKKKVIANIHSGWRGSVKNIIGKCLDTMILEFGCQPENILAGISPSLGPCCSEFVNYKDEIPENLWKYKINAENYFNFWEMSQDQLMDKGVKKDHIENMKICTKCNTDLFYSFRKEKTSGRFACVISMI